MKLVMVLVAALGMGVPAVTLSGDKALVIPAQDVKTQLAELVAQARPTGDIFPAVASYGNLVLHLSVRTANGVGELHPHFDDLTIVEEGTATLVTGGTLVDPKTGDNGEIRGTSVKGGTSRKITVGDVVIVPAGVPHQMLLPPGMVYKALVAKIKEP